MRNRTRKDSGSNLVLSILAGISLFVLAQFCRDTVQAGEPPLSVGIHEIATQELQDEQREVAGIMGEILAQMIERSMSEDRGYYAWITPLGLPPEESESMEALQNEGLMFVLTPQVSFSARGYMLRVKTFDLRAGEDNAPVKSWTDTAIMSPEANFREIESKIHELAVRNTRRMSGEASPERKVLFWCVEAVDTFDEELFTLCRRLTLEMPYYLAENEMLLEGDMVTGLNPRDFYRECAKRSVSLKGREREDASFEQNDFVIGGMAERIGENQEFRLMLWVDAAASPHSVPLEPIKVSGEVSAEQLGEIASTIAAHFLQAVEREELQPMPRR